MTGLEPAYSDLGVPTLRADSAHTRASIFITGRFRSGSTLMWQCPSCRDWETQRPASRVQFDTVLQHSITK